LMNFGGFATPERALVFDINDFDETLPGPFEWDVKRLATSFVLAARWLSFGPADARRSAASAVAAYRQALARFAGITALDTWCAQLRREAVVAQLPADPRAPKHLQKSVPQAEHNPPAHVSHKIPSVEDGRPRIHDQPPLLFHPDPSELDMERDVRPFFES